jgi:hypothetical protein
MSPLEFIFALLALTAVAAGCQRFTATRRRNVLARLAGEWNMQFVAADRFNLAPRICGTLPFPGAANVRVTDVIYQTESARRRLMFTCEFGQGTVRSQCRRHCVAAFEESCGAEALEPTLLVAPDKLALVEQYRWAKEKIEQYPE